MFISNDIDFASVRIIMGHCPAILIITYGINRQCAFGRFRKKKHLNINSEMTTAVFYTVCIVLLDFVYLEDVPINEQKFIQCRGTVLRLLHTVSSSGFLLLFANAFFPSKSQFVFLFILPNPTGCSARSKKLMNRE